MADYIPSTRDWVREQVELYEASGGTAGTTLRDTGLPVIIVTNLATDTGVIYLLLPRQATICGGGFCDGAIPARMGNGGRAGGTFRVTSPARRGQPAVRRSRVRRVPPRIPG